MGRALKTYADYIVNQKLEEFNFYYRDLELLVKSSFEWLGLSNGMTTRYIEQSLYDNGLVVFWVDKQLGFLRCSKATAVGLNEYGDPIGFRPISENGNVYEMLKSDECVACYNNYFRKGSIADVRFFAKKLENLERTVNMNLEQLKNPFIIQCSEGQVKSVENILSKKTDGQPYILGTESAMNDIGVKLFNLNVDNNTGDLQDIKHEYKNEALTFFGINNVNIVKKERLITGEAEQNNEEIDIHLNSRMKPRLEAIKGIYEKFGIEIGLDINKDMEYNVSRFMGEGV